MSQNSKPAVDAFILLEGYSLFDKYGFDDGDLRVEVFAEFPACENMWAQIKGERYERCFAHCVLLSAVQQFYYLSCRAHSARRSLAQRINRYAPMKLRPMDYR